MLHLYASVLYIIFYLVNMMRSTIHSEDFNSKTEGEKMLKLQKSLFLKLLVLGYIAQG